MGSINPIFNNYRGSVREVCFEGGIGVHIAALVISLICAIFSLFQGGIAMIFGGAGAGLAEFVGEESTEMSLVAGFGAFIFIAAFLGIIGGIFASLRKKAGWILLAITTAITLLAGIGMYGGMGSGMNDGFLYAIGYGLASFLAFRSCEATVTAETQSTTPSMEAPVSSAVPAIVTTAALTPQAHETPMAQTLGWTCNSCMTENDPENRFCFSCGQEREKPKPVCPHCGKENKPGMKFCPSCGTALPIQADTQGFEKKPANLSSTEIQGSPALSSHPCTVTAVQQSDAPKPAPFPLGAITVILLGVGILIAFLPKGEVFFSFFKGAPNVVASQETTQETRSGEGEVVVLPGTSPESSVILFYNLISKGQYEDAYELFSVNRKERVWRDNFRRGYQSTISSNVIGLEKYYQDNSIATVAVRVVSLDRSTTGGPDVKKAFQGEWTLVNVGGYWLLDKSNIKQVPVLPGE